MLAILCKHIEMIFVLKIPVKVDHFIRGLVSNTDICHQLLMSLAPDAWSLQNNFVDDFRRIYLVRAKFDKLVHFAVVALTEQLTSAILSNALWIF